MAVISKGIKLSYKTATEPSNYTDLTDLQEIPDLGGETEAIEITTLDDAAHKYTDGILNYGDSLAKVEAAEALRASNATLRANAEKQRIDAEILRTEAER